MGKFDFSGYATRNDLVCGDGRIIRKNAFVDNDGKEVPLVWNHKHSDLREVLGHALLENRDDGVYAYCSFNDTENGRLAKQLVQHGDIRSLSIYANQLKQLGNDVVHGMIRELSLVLAGANSGAFIDQVMAHGDDGEDGMIIGYDENIVLYHSDEKKKPEEGDPKEGEKKPEEGDPKEGEKKPEEGDPKEGEKKDGEKTIEDVINGLSEEEQNAVYALLGMVMEEKETKKENGGNEMKHNVFDHETETSENTLSHSAVGQIIGDGKRYGSMKESFLAHAEEYGIDNIEYLLPDVKSLNTPPEFISRNMGWVQKVMNSTHHTPFSRIKSVFADITEDDARARGYIKGKLKKEEVFSLLKRTTTPTTIYKKQKMDRDDINDITDFDVVSWLKSEMRMMLDEEIARAILIGDGRLASSEDKINEDNIRPILNDADLFTIRWSVATGTADGDKAKNFIKAAIKSRKNYKGSGTPTLFTTEDMLTDMLLLEDTIGHKLYKTTEELATALRVKEIVTVPVMEGLKDKNSKDVYGIIVNLADYNVGADKGGAINMFDDFDIDYNQQKYLIETRCSGALIKPFSAIVLRSGGATASEEPTLATAKAELDK